MFKFKFSNLSNTFFFFKCLKNWIYLRLRDVYKLASKFLIWQSYILKLRLGRINFNCLSKNERNKPKARIKVHSYEVKKNNMFYDIYFITITTESGSRLLDVQYVPEVLFIFHILSIFLGHMDIYYTILLDPF